MPRSPSPDRHRSHATTSRRIDDRPSERRRSRSPARRDREGDERRSSRRDEDERGDRRDDKRRERSRSRDRGERSSRRERDDRERSRSRERGHRSSRRRDPSTSGSDSDDSRERRHRSSRRRSRSRSRSRSRDRGDKDEKRRRRDEKKERKAKREQKKLAKKGVKVVEWGKHGILTEADIYTKNDEFHAWMIGEKTENPGTTTKAKEKELFKVFMEDFNTGTLPHEKYYDIAKYEKKMSAVRMGETVEEVDGGYDFNKDVEAAKSSHRRAAAPELNPLHNRAQLEALRKVQNDRIHVEKMKRLGLDVPQNMGARMEDKMSKG